MALDERLDEVEALAAAGRWSQMDAAVAAVERARTALAALSHPANGGSAAGAVAMAEHVDRLAELISAAPDAEKRGLLRALAASGGSPTDVHSRDHETANRGQRKGHQVVPVAPAAPATPAATPPQATASASPSPTPSPEPADESAEPSPSGSLGGGGSGHKDANSTTSQAKGNAPAQ